MTAADPQPNGATASENLLRVAVNGAAGRMGRETVAAVSAASDLVLVGEFDVGDDLAAGIADCGAQVVVDFTVASVAARNLAVILRSGAAAVIGTSGFGSAEVEQARRLCRETRSPAVIAPNFALASILLTRFAREAARHLPDVELIEMHHLGKEDAPSGTALKVAREIAAGRTETPEAPRTELVPGVRGGLVEGVPVHAVRLPGLLARMECVFGNQGETLTLRHDTLTRASFMPGVLLAVRRVRETEGLTYGLEHLLP